MRLVSFILFLIILIIPISSKALLIPMLYQQRPTIGDGTTGIVEPIRVIYTDIDFTIPQFDSLIAVQPRKFSLEFAELGDINVNSPKVYKTDSGEAGVSFDKLF